MTDKSAIAAKLRWSLLAPEDRVLVAVSGGPDSLCLLHVLWLEREARQFGDVEAAHLDHGLRGEESEAEADWVAAWCAERRIRCHVGKADVRAGRGQSVQQAARAARYAFLEQTAARVGANKIATGHTRDDQVETVLANVLRGTGPDGLRGIPERRGRIIRPLLDVTRAEVEAYNAANGLQPRLDPSNFSAEHYTRNRIRLELLPELRRNYNSAADAALLRLSVIASRDSDYLAEQAAAALVEVTRTADAQRLELGVNLELDRAALMALHPALRRYVLRQAMERVRGTGEGVTYEHSEAICEAVLNVAGAGFTLILPAPHCRVQVTEQVVTLSMAVRTAPATLVSAALPVPGEVRPEALGWTVRAAWEDHPGAVRLDADAVLGSLVFGSLVVRNRQAGDRIDPLGLGGRHKKVSDILTDAKVPRAERERIPIVADSRGILWIAGHAQAERAKVTTATTRRLFLSAQNTEQKK